ncbi:hypothetical protein CYMTET_42149 [Cymbomonas tetramitiformis]|uniref:Uncharacterized protein n=1 Tax=Cymbomonas tetramitiformis TaxID=36881 RepID=A0AAE0C5Z9_9CHLO|nr:hypothetical protein CYMTET_42149 [Cymbomonas tetramitiformis]
MGSGTIRRRRPCVHHQNFMVEHVTGKISQISRVILHTSGMDLSYWPLSDVHSALLWNILPHDGPKDVIPYHALRGHRFTYRRLEIFGALCHVAMDEQQMRDRRAGVSKKYLDRAWPGRFVGIELKSSAYKVLDLEKNVVTDVGDPQFVRRYDDFGQVMLSFPDPDTEPEVPAPHSTSRPEPYRDCTPGVIYTVHTIGAYYHAADGETYATVQLRDPAGDTFWTSASQYLTLADPFGDAYYVITQWLARRRAIDCVNQYFPLWTVVKAQERRGAPRFPPYKIRIIPRAWTSGLESRRTRLDGCLVGMRWR